jgi:subtilisin
MSISKKLAFCTLFVGFLVIIPTSFASADNGRYFVHSTKNFVKSILPVRHVFSNGFTADLSDFQVRLVKLMGLQIEPVTVYQILNTSNISTDIKTVSPTPVPPVLGPAENSKVTLTPSPESNLKSFRPAPTDQVPWGIQAIYNDSNIASISGGFGVKVAVLDTGADVGHPDLKNRIIRCEDFTNFKYPVQDKKCDDNNGHGTHIAGIIAADGGTDGTGIYGVAPEAKLMIYKVCGDGGTCYADDIAAAIKLAADQGANVINMGFGGDDDSSIIDGAVNYAVSKNVLIIAAAGNDGPDNDGLDYPAALSSVVAVGALDESLNVVDWSSRGKNDSTASTSIDPNDLEFVAPGADIESTANDGSYITLSGTSMASAFVSGLAAKFWQSDEKNPANATREFLHSIATDILPPGQDDMSGFGLPQIPIK